jgi:hypothetical protein
MRAALFSGVQDRLQVGIGPLKAWLFPKRVYLQLEDQAITAMALEGRRIVWLETIQLPVGLCENGEPIRTDSLGDLLGDLFVERGYAGARVDAVLPAAASQMRLVQWPEGRWPEDPERTLALHENQLRLRMPLGYLDLHIVDFKQEPPVSLLVTVPSSVLDKWIEVCLLAGLSLNRMEAAKTCVCRGLLAMRSSVDVSGTLVLQLEHHRSSVLLVEDDIPRYERRLPGVEQPQELQSELASLMRFCRQQFSAFNDYSLCLHGSAVGQIAQVAGLSELFDAPWQIVDPIAEGWLVNISPEFGMQPDGSSLALLWGLAATEVMT